MFGISDIHVSVLSGKLRTSPRTGSKPNHLEIADHTVTVRSATVKYIWMMGFRAGRHSQPGKTSNPSNKDKPRLTEEGEQPLYDLPAILLAEN